MTALRPGRLLPLLILLLALLHPIPAPAADYHVSTDPCASDDNTGLSPTCGPNGNGPWKSIESGLERLKPGDSLLLGPGVFRQSQITIARGGAKGKPITLAALNPGKAVLDGQGAPDWACGLLIEPGASHIVVKGLVIQHFPDNGLATDPEPETPYEDITIQGCQMRENRASGMELAAVHGFTVKDSTFTSNGYYGLNIIGSKTGRLSSGQGLVQNCSFDSHTGPDGHGLAVNQGNDIQIIGCKASHNRSHGFDVSDWPKKGLLSHDILFQNNLSHDNGKAGFAVNSDSSRVTYIRNTAWNNGAAWASKQKAPGFWCYEGCRECAWINNTAVGNSLAGFRADDRAGAFDGKPETASLTFINNIAWDNGQPQWNEMWALHLSDADWLLTLENNNFGALAPAGAKIVRLRSPDGRTLELTARDIQAGKLPRHNLSLDPGFADQSRADFSLAPGSPMIDAGRPAAGIDHKGRAPDIGAFEQTPKGASGGWGRRPQTPARGAAPGPRRGE